MCLNIKDPEASRLARAISRATGESITHVVIEALRERFAKIEKQNARADIVELVAIADRAAAYVKHPYTDHGDLLYDEKGIPK